MDALTVQEVRPDDARLLPLIEAHLAHSAFHAPDTSCHTMTREELLAEPGLRMWLASDGAIPVGCAALKPLGGPADAAEVKSVHVASAGRGRGVARSMMAKIIVAAKAAGHPALMLETGSDQLQGYGAARGLYEALGFAYCGPFKGYADDPASVYMTLPLTTLDASSEAV